MPIRLWQYSSLPAAAAAVVFAIVIIMIIFLSSISKILKEKHTQVFSQLGSKFACQQTRTASAFGTFSKRDSCLSAVWCMQETGYASSRVCVDDDDDDNINSRENLTSFTGYSLYDYKAD